MKIEFIMILALVISGMINYLASWMGKDERERNMKRWGKSGPSSIKGLMFVTILSLVSVASGLYFFLTTDIFDVSYMTYAAIFESSMISLYLSMKFIGKNGDLRSFRELLSGYTVIVPMIALVVSSAFILLGYVDMKDSGGIMIYGIALIALAMIIFGVVIVSAEVIYFRVKDMAKIDSWKEKILSQEKKSVLCAYRNNNNCTGFGNVNLMKSSLFLYAVIASI